MAAPEIKKIALSLNESISRLEQISSQDASPKLSGHCIKKQPLSYAIYQKKPYLPIGLTFQYRTAFLVSVSGDEKSTQLEIKKQMPAFIPVLSIILAAGILFNIYLFNSSFPIELFLILLVVDVLIILFHFQALNNIEDAFGSAFGSDAEKVD